jgi:hypothetical protein
MPHIFAARMEKRAGVDNMITVCQLLDDLPQNDVRVFFANLRE